MNDESAPEMANLDDGPPACEDGVSPALEDTAASSAEDEDAVWRALARVIDPEIGLDIVTLGLVYGVEQTEGEVRITFSLTTSGCPLEEVITRGITEAVGAVPGLRGVTTELVWEPRWHPGMIGEVSW